MADWQTASGPVTHTTNLTPDHSPAPRQSETTPNLEIRTIGGKTEIVSNAPAEYHANPADIDPSEGILASARTEAGGFIGDRAVNGKDTITLPGGMQTSVAVAAKIGYLTKNADGSYTETQKATAEANTNPIGVGSDTPDAKADEPAAFTIGDEGEALMTEIVQQFPQSQTLAAMDEIIQRGEISTDRLAAMASSMSMEPGQVAEKFGAVHEAFHSAASGHLEGRGVIDEDAFAAFLSENPHVTRDLAKAARDLVMSNSTKGLDAVADAFLEKSDRYMQEDVKAALEEAGYGHQQDGRGGLLVVLNSGAQVPFNVAVRQKVITFTR